MARTATTSSKRGVAKPMEGGKYVKIKKSDWDAIVAEEENNLSTLHQLKTDKTALTTSLAQSETLVQNLRKKVAELEKKRGKRKSTCRKDEQKDDVKEGIKNYVKDVLFRTVKFAQPGKELKSATLSVWNGIKSTMKLDEGAHPLTSSDFVEIYDSEVATQLSARRQYVQSRMQEACAGT